jgi:hypothetical protein
MRRWLSATIAAVIAAGLVAALTHSQLATVAACLTVYAVEMLRRDTPHEAVMRCVLEKEAQEHLYYNLERKKWEWLGDRELEERLELESRLENSTRDNKGKPEKAMSVGAQPGTLIPLSELRDELSAAQPEAYKSGLEPLLDSLEAKYGNLVPVVSIEELIPGRLRHLEEQRQEIVDREAKKGKTIEIAALRQRLEATKATYTGSDSDAYANEVNRLLDVLVSKYGSCIPVDEAYRIMQKLERGM